MATVSDESCGGAEQMLYVLEREMARRNCRTTVAACAGSEVAGTLLSTGSAALSFDQLRERDAEHNARVLGFLREAEESGRPVSLVHDEGGRFWRHAAAVDVPVLVTLHLPRSFYAAELFENIPGNVYFNCVSRTQAKSFADLPRMSVVRNGIPLERFPFTAEKRDYLVWLGRICPEKGLHIAVEAARQAGMKLVIMGPSYLYERDRQYFEGEVAPRLTAACEFIGSPSFARKIEVLRHARALLMPSLAQETSSLVCLEAMACGTPAIAFRNGALPEVVLDGQTGFTAGSTQAMVQAMHELGTISPHACREHVAANHSARRMADQYEQLYDLICAEETALAAEAATSFELEAAVR